MCGGEWLALSVLDYSAPSAEERWVTLGLANTLLLLVVHTRLDHDDEAVCIRIISARRPTRNERRHYEQG
jgi:hypothetical protein